MAEIDTYQSFSLTRRWHKYGEFELTVNRYMKDADLLQKRYFIVPGSELNKSMIILHKEISLSEKGKQSENITIKGTTLSGLTAQRLIVPPSGSDQDSITGPAETVMKHYMSAHLVNPTDANRKMDIVSLTSDQARGSSLTWQSRYDNLAEQLEKISLASGIGWNIFLDLVQMKAVFDVLIGRDLTAGQSINPPVIFSPDFDAIKSQHYVDSDLNYKNVAYVGGQGEGAARTIAIVGTDTGLNRIESFVDARDIADSVQLTDKGNQALEEVKVDQLLEGEILTNGPFEYGVDYDLGDVVTIQNKGWGVTMDARITEIKETYERDGMKLDATFGNSFPTLITKIKQEFGQMSAEVRR